MGLYKDIINQLALSYRLSGNSLSTRVYNYFQDSSLLVKGGFYNFDFTLQRPLFRQSKRGYLKVLEYYR